MRLSRLRDQVSSMNPVASEISAWNTTWNRMMPASRKATPRGPVPDCRLKYTPSEPNSTASTTGQKTTSNQR